MGEQRGGAIGERRNHLMEISDTTRWTVDLAQRPPFMTDAERNRLLVYFSITMLAAGALVGDLLALDRAFSGAISIGAALALLQSIAERGRRYDRATTARKIMRMRYPASTKLSETAEKTQIVGEFLDWLEHGGLGEKQAGPCGRITLASESNDRLQAIGLSIDQLLAAFFEVDLETVEEERRDMLRSHYQNIREADA